MEKLYWINHTNTKKRLKEHKKCAMNANETRVLYKALKNII